jgi:Ca-activated chloride channel family protein
MNRVLLIFAFVVVQTNLFGQIVVDKTHHDFGDIYAHNERFVDFYFKNTGSARAFILRVEKQENIVYQLSSSVIESDQSVVVRIQVAQKKKGPFTYKIPVYLSDRNEPVILKISGNIKELAPDLSTLTDCPTFNRRPYDGNPMDFMLTVVTVDKETKQVLEKSRVEVLQQGLTIGDWRTDKDGKVQKKIPLGFTYFYASREGYHPNELGAYVNFQRNYILIELERLPQPTTIKEDPFHQVLTQPSSPVHQPETGTVKPEPEEIEWVIGAEPTTPTKPTKPLKSKPENVSTPEPRLDIPALTDIPKEDFNPEYFVPNNLVFVLDVSYSMNTADRMELMKLALIELMKYVRPEDKITVVSYGSNAQVLVPTTSGANKEEIIDKVSKIKAAGMTAGGAGIKLGYRMAQHAFIPGGNNQIIVITDGAFNKDSDDYERTIKRSAPKGYVLSVVGIKNKPEDEVKMAEVATLGKGRFIGINSISDARTKLIEEIRVASYGSRP